MAVHAVIMDPVGGKKAITQTDGAEAELIGWEWDNTENIGMLNLPYHFKQDPSEPAIVRNVKLYFDGRVQLTITKSKDITDLAVLTDQFNNNGSIILNTGQADGIPRSRTTLTRSTTVFDPFGFGTITTRENFKVFPRALVLPITDNTNPYTMQITDRGTFHVFNEMLLEMTIQPFNFATAEQHSHKLTIVFDDGAELPSHKFKESWTASFIAGSGTLTSVRRPGGAFFRSGKLWLVDNTASRMRQYDPTTLNSDGRHHVGESSDITITRAYTGAHYIPFRNAVFLLDDSTKRIYSFNPSFPTLPPQSVIGLADFSARGTLTTLNQENVVNPRRRHDGDLIFVDDTNNIVYGIEYDDDDRNWNPRRIQKAVDLPNVGTWGASFSIGSTFWFVNSTKIAYAYSYTPSRFGAGSLTRVAAKDLDFTNVPATITAATVDPATETIYLAAEDGLVYVYEVITDDKPGFIQFERATQPLFDASEQEYALGDTVLDGLAFGDVQMDGS